jgi:hypothetical protein
MPLFFWKHLCLLACLLLPCSLPRAARAGACPSGAIGAPAQDQAEAHARLRFIRERLALEARHARLWSTGWIGGQSALAAGQLALVPLFSPEDRIDLYVGAGASIIGLGSVLVTSPKVKRDHRTLEAHVRAAGEADPCSLLAEAETSFLRDARDEMANRGLLSHGANLAFNIGTGLFLGLYAGHWKAGAINTVAGTLIGEAMILTRPNRLNRDLEHYRAGDFSSTRTTGRVIWTLLPVIAPERYGVMVVGRF